MMKKTARYHSERFRLNNQLVWVIAPVLLIAPLVFGSNRPVFWLLWATVLSVCGAWCFARMASSNARFRISPMEMPVVSMLFATLAAYMLVQVLPLGSLAPAATTIADPNGVISLQTISLTPGDTVLALIRWLSYGLMFFFVLQITANQQRARGFLKLLYWGIVLHAFLGLALLFHFGDTVVGIEKWAYRGSATGGFINRNSFATFLAFGSVLGVNLMLERMITKRLDGSDPSLFGTYLDKGGVVPIALGWIVLVITLIATNSRMGLFAAFCGMVFSIVLALAKRDGKATGKPLWLLLIAIPIVIGIGIFAYGATLIERVGHLESSSDIRMQLYQQVITMIEARPFIGFGGNSFEYAYPLFHKEPVNFDLVWELAHSTYLALWAEYGLVFGSIPLVIIAILLFQLFSVYVRSPRQDIAVQTGLAVIVVAAVHSLVDFSLEIQAVTFLFVALVATAWARQFEMRSTLDRPAS